jgi:hypothetical protein
MKTLVFTFCALTAAALMAPALANDDATTKPADAASAEAQLPPPVPATPAAVDDILYARRFTLQQGYTFEWARNGPLVTEGTILVLKVNPALVYPRQALEPVLYVGNQTAERVNLGHESGRVIAIVPGKLDLKTSPIWFGTPELPERVDAEMVKAERALAEKAKIAPFTGSQIEKATTPLAETMDAANRDELRRRLAAIVKEYSPVEKGLIRTLEAIPDPKAGPKPEED